MIDVDIQIVSNEKIGEHHVHVVCDGELYSCTVFSTHEEAVRCWEDLRNMAESIKARRTGLH